MKKIAILTVHSAKNAGAVLQAFALQKYIASLDDHVHVSIINYRCKYVEDNYLLNIWKGKSLRERIKNIVKRILFGKSYKTSCENYEKFLKKYHVLTEREFTDSNIGLASDNFDAFIVGSDQVWNHTIVHNSLSAFLLEFCDCDAKKYSYAASFGFTERFIESKEIILRNLPHFSGISLRETIGAEEIYAATDIEPFIHIDPTLLLEAETYNDICKGQPIISEKYIVVYNVLNSKKIMQFSKKLQKLTKYKLIYLDKRAISLSKRTKYLCYTHPGELLSMIKNAEYICTSSFHGVAFSILFQKKFFTVIKCDNGYNYRVENLLNLLNLQERDIEIMGNDYNKNIHWNDVESRLQKERKRSDGYFKMILANLRRN